MKKITRKDDSYWSHLFFYRYSVEEESTSVKNFLDTLSYHFRIKYLELLLLVYG